MDNSWYMVDVDVIGVWNEINIVEHIPFKSLYAARYMAKQYYKCSDVNSVVVINQTTGEIMYRHDCHGEYDVEG